MAVWRGKTSSRIEGLHQALLWDCLPAQGKETEWGDLESVAEKLETKIAKVSNKYYKDERTGHRDSLPAARSLIEDYVADVMSSLSQACYDKPWFIEVDFTASLTIAAGYSFIEMKPFSRTLTPTRDRIIEEGVKESFMKWQEDERIGKVMWDAVDQMIADPAFKKKAYKHLSGSFDEAHRTAPFGESGASDIGLGLLMDFVKGWMREFCRKGRDILENGLGPGSEFQKLTFLTGLFEFLVSPTVACVPREVGNELKEGLPAAPWFFVSEQAGLILLEMATNPGGPPFSMQAFNKKPRLL